MSKAQVSFFIIFAVIIVAAFTYMISSYYVEQSNSREKLLLSQKTITDVDALAVKDYIDSCMESELEFGYELALRHNAPFDNTTYLQLPNNPSLVKLDFFYENYERTELKFNHVEEYVEGYLEEQLIPCIVHSWPFFNQSFDAKIHTLPQAEVIIDSDSIKAQVDMSVIITKGLELYQLSTFSYEINQIPLQTLEDDVNWLTQEIRDSAVRGDGEFTDEFISRLGARKDMRILSFKRENEEGWEFMISYSSDYWHSTYYFFNVDLNTKP